MQEEIKENEQEIINETLNQNLASISWDDYFSTIAEITSLRSKDPVRKVGAIIVSKDNKILSTGYNGAPRGISDNEIPWEKSGKFLDTKYPYIVHAELNAILNYNREKGEALLKGAKIYTTLFPCNECMKAIIQSGITEVIYLDNHNYKKDAYVASRKMVKIRNSNPDFPNITLRGYKRSVLATLLTAKTVLQDKIIIPEEEIESYDNTTAFNNLKSPKKTDSIDESELNKETAKPESTLKLTFGKKENK